jgi:hypothetical protein
LESWPKDTTAAKNAFDGDFHAPDWHGKFLARITPPFQMFYDKHPMPSILVNRMHKLPAKLCLSWKVSVRPLACLPKWMQARHTVANIQDAGRCAFVVERR